MVTRDSCLCFLQFLDYRFPEKNAVLNIRINSEDPRHLKQKVKKLGVPCQTFISEILRHYAG